MNILVEDWGGKFQSRRKFQPKAAQNVDYFSKKYYWKQNSDLKANPNRKASGSVIEASLDKGRGYMQPFWFKAEH